ncbi:four-carbon acid sugar kinase family protein [Streptomyces sp. NPDC056632]|uniref:four-carbon acid sugar kinase family protein n=1 Tax=Streptomyces sp. NPDC056632 TaxID=3345884 RepID=UPI0036934A6D
MSPSTVVVLADDLTSAADGAAPFRRSGHRALVLFAPEAHGPGVTAVDLGTRLLAEPEAAARTGEAAEAYAGADLLVKTVDSTLRGHVAAELRAALAGSGRRAAVLAPAFPTEGRTTVGGVQYVRGVRVDASEFARDPAHPVRTADLTELLPEAVLVEPGHAGSADLPRLVDSGGVFVCSAVTEADLDAVVAAVPRPQDILWVGSPGLAAALARRHTRRPADPLPELPAVRRPLTVVGSANPASRRQLAALHAESGKRGPHDTATTPPPRASVRTLHTPDERSADSTGLLDRLAGAAVEMIRERRADGLVLTGGETAAAVLGALGATGIELYDEPEPGIARGTLHGPTAPRLPVLVKAGGFGDDGTLVRLHAVLTGASAGEAEGPAAARAPGEGGYSGGAKDARAPGEGGYSGGAKDARAPGQGGHSGEAKDARGAGEGGHAGEAKDARGAGEGEHSGDAKDARAPGEGGHSGGAKGARGTGKARPAGGARPERDVRPAGEAR